MKNTWDITLHPVDEIYSQWLKFNEAKGIVTRGSHSTIGPISTKLFEDAMIKAMEAHNVTGS